MHREWRRQARITQALLVVVGLDCLLGLFRVPLGAMFSLRPGGAWWAVLTYPLAADPLNLLFAGFWIYLAGGELEARWGARRYGLFLAASVPLSSLPLLLGAMALRQPFILAGPLLPLACLTVAWCLGNWGGVVLLGFLVPIPVKVLLVLEFALVYLFSAMSMSPLLAVTTLAGPGLCYLYAARLGPDARILGAIQRSRRKHTPPRRRKGLRLVKP